MITQYIRDNKGRKRGMLVAINRNAYSRMPMIGWSLCNKKDKFNKRKAEEIARGRAYFNKKAYSAAYFTKDLVPEIVNKAVVSGFGNRAMNYFKVENRTMLDIYVDPVRVKAYRSL